MIQIAKPKTSKYGFFDRLKRMIPDHPVGRAYAPRALPLLEGLEMRRLLASISHSDVTTTTATAAFLDAELSAPALADITAHGLTTGDDWRFVNVSFNEALAVPQFNAAPGQVLTKVVIEGNLGVLQDFNGSVTNNNGVNIDLVANGSATVAFDSDTLDLDAAVAVSVSETIPGDFAPHAFAEHDIDGQGTDYDDLGDTGVLTPNSPVSAVELTALDGALFDAFKGAGNVNFQVSGTSTTAFSFIGGGNEVQDLKFVTVGRADVKVTYVFGTPQAKISIAPDDVNEVGDPHTFTVTVEQDDGLAAGEGGDGVDGFTASTVGNVDVTLTDSNGAAAILDLASSTVDDNQPAGDNLDPSGQAVAVFTSNTAGKVTGHATATLSILGQTVVVETDGLGDNSDDAVKTFVDAFITIDPDGVNPVGAPHTFTATVYEDTGDGVDSDLDGSTFDPAVAENVTITLANSNGAVANPAGPFNGVTDANGEFDVTFTSATAGTVTGHASSNVQVGGLSLARETDGVGLNSDDAIKTFEQPPGGEGLTPGFWKQNATFRSKVTGNIGQAWIDAGYSPNQTLSSVGFVIPGYGSKTLLQGLNLGGGGLKALIRHAVAAILNAGHPDIDYGIATPGEVVTQVNAAVLAGGSAIEDLKDVLDDFNNAGGGVDQHGQAF